MGLVRKVGYFLFEVFNYTFGFLLGLTYALGYFITISMIFIVAPWSLIHGVLGLFGYFEKLESFLDMNILQVLNLIVFGYFWIRVNILWMPDIMEIFVFPVPKQLYTDILTFLKNISSYYKK